MDRRFRFLPWISNDGDTPSAARGNTLWWVGVLAAIAVVGVVVGFTVSRELKWRIDSGVVVAAVGLALAAIPILYAIVFLSLESATSGPELAWGLVVSFAGSLLTVWAGIRLRAENGGIEVTPTLVSPALEAAASDGAHHPGVAVRVGLPQQQPPDLYPTLAAPPESTAPEPAAVPHYVETQPAPGQQPGQYPVSQEPQYAVPQDVQYAVPQDVQYPVAPDVQYPVAPDVQYPGPQDPRDYRPQPAPQQR